MNLEGKIYVAGHRGLVGSAIVRALGRAGYTNLALRTHAELDLTDQAAVREFFASEQPRYVFLAASKVGGILANSTYPAEFIFENLTIQVNIIESAYKVGVQRLLFLGSSCIYPKFAAQPMREDCLLSGTLEPTNRPYAVAKIAGIEMCWAYNRQYGTRYLAVMPTNLYGPGDNYHPDHSHVVAALIRRFHEAKQAKCLSVTVWGTGTPQREFLYVEDFADACVFVLENYDGDQHLNIGLGEDVSIADFARLVAHTVGYEGEIVFDARKPDGTPRKLVDTSRLTALGWRARTSLREGLSLAYRHFLAEDVDRREV